MDFLGAELTKTTKNMQRATMANIHMAPAVPPFVKEKTMLIKDHAAVFPTETGDVSPD